MNRVKLTTPMFSRAFGAAAIVLFCLALARPASAQTVTASDVQRLQDQVYDASNEVSRLRSRDSVLADRLQTQLDDLRDDVVYLRVKLRKEGTVSRRDYNDVRTQVESVRSEARGNVSGNSSGNASRDSEPVRQGSATWPSGGSGRPRAGASSRT